MNLFISADIEGITGVVHNAHVNWPGSDYERARKWMAADINAAIEGALEVGARRIVVNDAHGEMRNLIPDDLHPAAELVSGPSRPLGMLQGLDESFALVFCIGYHARTGSPEGIINHTFSGSVVSELRLNGQVVGELTVNAALAGEIGVPVGLVTGDEATVLEARELLGEVEGVAVKKGYGRYAALCLHPEESRRRIFEAAKRAMTRVEQFRPYRLSTPIALELRFPRTPMADAAELIPHVRRVDGVTITYEARSMVEANKLLQALVILADAAMPKQR
ncbi:MAG: peptidase M55 [Anaerolineae bacterium]|nr:peptidase M55 [Anaerolineae bacterium]NIN95570.1 peptidase M55 [Anaerolineae bacterium]NIQ79191.1 peptidase M55 [Anaerolineae bacterium]